MIALVNSVLSQMSSLKKPQKSFIALLLSMLIIVQGKANFRNMSRYCNSSEKRFSRWYHKAFDFLSFNEILIFQQLPKQSRCIAAMDASFMRKSGKHTEGLGKFFHGAIGKAENGLELSLISIVDIEANTAYALDAMQTIDAPKPKNEDEDEITRIDLYAEQAVRIAPILIRHNIHYMAIDSYYTKYKYVTPITDSGLDAVGKLRCDANLRWLYKGEYSGVGRPKKYDGKINFDKDLHRFEYEGMLEENIQVYSAVVHSICLERNIKVAMLICNRGGKTARVLLFCTDTELDAMTLIAYYKARFQIEFVFRDAKQFTGLMDCQARKKEAIHTHINASLTALNVLKFEDAMSKDCHSESVISIASWKRRKFNQYLMKIIFDKLDIDPSNEKVSQVISELEEFGVIAA